MPLYIMIAVTPLDFAFIAQTWRNPGIRRLTQVQLSPRQRTVISLDDVLRGRAGRH
jgi:hypothetical protein